MHRLYLDTALSGRLLSREEDNGHTIGLADKRQPHLVRIAYMGVDHEGLVRASCHLIMQQPGWLWDDDAIAGHGIDYDTAMNHGVPLAVAMGDFLEALAGADELVSFNMHHHERVLRKTAIDLGGTFAMPVHVQPFCAMRMSSNFVRKTRTDRRPGFHWPKLTEAYAYFSGGLELLPVDDDPFEVGHSILQALRVIREGIEAMGGGAQMTDEDLNNLIRLLTTMSRTAEVRMPGASFTTGELLTVMREAAAHREQQRSIPR